MGPEIGKSSESQPQTVPKSLLEHLDDLETCHSSGLSMTLLTCPSKNRHTAPKSQSIQQSWPQLCRKPSPPHLTLILNLAPDPMTQFVACLWPAANARTHAQLNPGQESASWKRRNCQSSEQICISPSMSPSHIFLTPVLSHRFCKTRKVSPIHFRLRTREAFWSVFFSEWLPLKMLVSLLPSHLHFLCASLQHWKAVVVAWGQYIHNPLNLEEKSRCSRHPAYHL